MYFQSSFFNWIVLILVARIRKKAYFLQFVRFVSVDPIHRLVCCRKSFWFCRCYQSMCYSWRKFFELYPLILFLCERFTEILNLMQFFFLHFVWILLSFFFSSNTVIIVRRFLSCAGFTPLDSLLGLPNRLFSIADVNYVNSNQFWCYINYDWPSYNLLKLVIATISCLVTPRW